jgi:urease accessory protein
MNTSLSPAQMTALLQLASPALPIGGFSYSQGLEAAIEHGLIKDAESAQHWIADHLRHALTACELPVWVMQYRHLEQADAAALAHWNEWFLATRETRELRLETEQMGWSLVQLAQKMVWGDADQRALLEVLASHLPVALPTAYACAAAMRHIPLEAGLTAYAFTWIENQVAAAVKAVPLGQIAGQRMLDALQADMPDVLAEALQRAEAPPRLSTFSPQLAILSARHETQYSRLFRS